MIPLNNRVVAPLVLELPTGPTGVSWRAATSADIDAIHDCEREMGAADHPHYVTPREEIAEEFHRGKSLRTVFQQVVPMIDLCSLGGEEGKPLLLLQSLTLPSTAARSRTLPALLWVWELFRVGWWARFRGPTPPPPRKKTIHPMHGPRVANQEPAPSTRHFFSTFTPTVGPKGIRANPRLRFDPAARAQEG